MKLYHFTSLQNLDSILRSDQFRLSSFERANDFKEKIDLIRERNHLKNQYKYFSTCIDTDESGILLLSKSNEAMWYHYANKHKGVCIEFDKETIDKELESNNINVVTTGRINYRGGVNHIDNQPDIEYLMEKRICWRYEEEYRYIFPYSVDYIPNVSKFITKIYFGCNVEWSEIIEFVNKNKIDYSIELFKMGVNEADGRLITSVEYSIYHRLHN